MHRPKKKRQRCEINVETSAHIKTVEEAEAVQIPWCKLHFHYQVIDQVMDRTNEAVLAVAAVNGPRALSGVREADGLVRNYDGANWNRVVTTNEVLYALGISLGAYADGPQSLIRDGSYRIDHLVTSYVNSDGGVLHFVTTMDLTISLLGGDSLTVTRPLEVRTTYEAKF